MNGVSFELRTYVEVYGHAFYSQLSLQRKEYFSDKKKGLLLAGTLLVIGKEVCFLHELFLSFSFLNQANVSH